MRTDLEMCWRVSFVLLYSATNFRLYDVLVAYSVSSLKAGLHVRCKNKHKHKKKERVNQPV